MFSGSYLLGDVDFADFYALGFAWGGFAWDCDSGVYFCDSPRRSHSGALVDTPR